MGAIKVILLAAVSLDGKIAESSDQLADWTSKEDKKFFVRKTKEAGVLILGRRTYETIGRPLPGRLNIVMTRDSSGHENQPGLLEFTSKTPREIVDELADRGFKEAVVAGGSEIYSLFMRDKLVTDLYLTIEPVIFGEGVPLVKGVPITKLRLVGVERIGEQSVLLHYAL